MFAMKSLGMIVKGSVPFGLRSPTLLQRKLYSPQRLRCPRNSSLPKATSIPTSTYTESPLIKPDLLDDADGPSAKVLALEGNIERVIYGCRFFTLLSVAGSLFGSVICFLKGCVYVLDSFKVGIGGGGKVIMILVEAVDIYLIGTVMLVFGMGIYELFISNLDIAKTSTDGSNMLGLFKLVERPQWLEIKSLNELETKFGNVIVTVLLVGLLEKCKKVEAAGFNANMITYLTDQLHLPLVEASNTLTNFSGTSSLTPIVGALVADSIAGKFWTIAVGSIIYLLGMISLTLSAIIPALRPPTCITPHPCQKASSSQLIFLYASLICTSIGTGGIRPCVVAFGADQFDIRATHNKGKRSFSFFNLYFFSMGVAMLLALTVVVYIQDNVGWGWGLGIPTIVMIFSVLAFVSGYPMYLKLKPSGSPMTRLTQVIVAAVKKRKLVRPTDSSILYEDNEMDAAISATGRLLHTNQLEFFDRAAIVTDGDMISGRPCLWRLSTVHRIEELKSIIRMIPIWAVGIFLVTAGSHNSTFTIQQARSMDRHLTSNFQIPPASMSIFSVSSMLISLAFYDRVFVPVTRRFTGLPSGITYLQRTGIGLAIAILSSVAAALVEVKRKSVASRHGLLDDASAMIPVSVFWLVPQYAIFGLAEAFMSVGHMEFLYDQAPESMRSTAAALFWLAGSIGSYMGTALVTAVSKYSKGKGEWLPDNINRGKLDYYYWLVAGLGLFNFLYYLVCARFYRFKPLEVVKSSKVLEEEDGGGDMELLVVRE